MANKSRVTVDGVHLNRHGIPFRIRGATYGSFLPRGDGALFPEPEQIATDMRSMARVGLNAVRTYTAPPQDLLDSAQAAGLQVIIGLHYDDWRMSPNASAKEVLAAGRRSIHNALQVAGDHPATLAICVGNEVPADLVRVVGIRTVERVLSALIAEVHRIAPTVLATYASYPTTEFLRVEGQDFASFNVFLEDDEDLRAYLRRLQVQAGDVPVLLSEVGLASEVHGEAEQAAQLAVQLQVADEVGLAGACVFSWTDEWGVAGTPVEGWGFGLTRADRTEKLAVREVREWALRDVSELRDEWPQVSVVVCAYNEEATIRECLTSLVDSQYPSMEVLLCDDGSTDDTLRLAKAFADDPRIRILELPHAGLSAARNAGLHEATGTIVAYLDADAACHPHWLHHLALSLEDPDIVATGGPNLPPGRAGFVERAVADSPGAPQHVLISHDRAEHVPGCNMAFRTEALRSVGGFDVAYTSAGDDVDVCWKLLDRGMAIGFAPAAMVWHHRRGTVRGYLRQQRGYGRSEKMLSGPHAHRFNRVGQARWGGVIYANPLRRLLRPVVYAGVMGSAPYQPATRLRGQDALSWVGALLPLTIPVAVLGLLATLADPRGFLITAAALVTVLGYGGAAFVAVRPSRHEARPVAHRALAAWLHVAQPFVRTWGRLRGPRLSGDLQVLRPQWTGDRFAWLNSLTADLQAEGLVVRPSKPTDAHDLTAYRTPLLSARVRTAMLWQWTPVSRMRLSLRPTALVLLLLSGVAVWSGGLAGVGLLVAVLAIGAVDAITLAWTVRRTLAIAERAAEASTADPRDVVIDLSEDETAHAR